MEDFTDALVDLKTMPEWKGRVTGFNPDRDEVDVVLTAPEAVSGEAITCRPEELTITGRERTRVSDFRAEISTFSDDQLKAMLSDLRGESKRRRVVKKAEKGARRTASKKTDINAVADEEVE